METLSLCGKFVTLLLRFPESSRCASGKEIIPSRKVITLRGLKHGTVPF